MDKFLGEFPEREKLLEWYVKNGTGSIPDVNAHIHTPWSFSAFDDPEQAFIQASEEKVTVLGINDFNTTRGYDSFFKLGMTYRIFPLFNIEFMGLMREEQKNGVRINDPGNPGRIYFSGKGLDYPVSMGKRSDERLGRLREEGHRQVREMIAKLNSHLHSLNGNMQLDFDEILRNHTMGMVRERHIARVLRILIYGRYEENDERVSFLEKLFGGSRPASPVDNEAAVENEIRSRLLKSGGVAFVEEDPDAFPGLGEIISIITDAGGVPCYPVLLDDQDGRLTEFEADPEKLCDRLRSYDVSCIELIPGRNDINRLRDFVLFFRERDFVILFGTEHNTPGTQPLRVTSRGDVPLDEELRKISYEGACVIAAHQYLRAKGEEGYPSLKRSGAASLGKAVIEYFGKI